MGNKKLIIIIGLIVLFAIIRAAPEPAFAQEGDVSLEGLRRIASFEVRESADKLAENLRKDGYEAVVLDDVDDAGKTIYFVFAGLPESEAEIPVPMAGETVAAIPGSVLGKKKRIIHPYLAVTESYTDNVYSTKDETEGDFVTIVSAGLWVAKNAGKERLLAVGTSPISPGGHTLSRLRASTFRRYKIFLQYQLDYAHFSNKHSSENTISHSFNGLLQYNLRGGLSVSLYDQWVLSYTDRGEGDLGKYDELGRYTTNNAGAIVYYDFTEKIKLRADYANFIVDYDLDRDDFRNRVDNYFSGYVFFHIRPKTSIFAQGTFIDIDYDGGVYLDSQESHFYGGISWEITAKSIGLLKAGYGTKEFDDPQLETANYVIAEAQLSHRFTPKTSMTLSASRKTNETDIAGASHILSTTFSAGLSHRLTGKVSAALSAAFVKNEYKDAAYARADDMFRAGFSMSYAFKKWLSFSAGYSYSRKKSNLEEYDYYSNTVFVKAMGRL